MIKTVLQCPFRFHFPFSVSFLRLAVLPSQLDEQNMQSASILNFTHGVTRYIHTIVVTKFFEGQTAAKAERSRMGV